MSSHPDDIKNAVRIVEVLSSNPCWLMTGKRRKQERYVLTEGNDTYFGESITACLIAAGLMEKENETPYR